MNNETYLKKVRALCDELERAAISEPFDPVVYNAVMLKIRAFHDKQKRTPRRRPWAALASCIILLIVLLYIVYSILCFLLILDRS